MKQRHWRVIFSVFLVFSMIAMASCAKKQVVRQEPKPGVADENPLVRKRPIQRQPTQQMPRTTEQPGFGEEQRGPLTSEQISARDQFEASDIYFAYDSSALTMEAQQILRQKAQWLRQNQWATIVIEGHCDERGTNEYNLALGDRRAEAVKAFLVDLGISPARMITVSYGEERPADPRSTEDAWARNRRAHFVVR